MQLSNADPDQHCSNLGHRVPNNGIALLSWQPISRLAFVRVPFGTFHKSISLLGLPTYRQVGMSLGINPVLPKGEA